MKQLSIEEMMYLHASGEWKKLDEEQKKQFMNFMFGEEFMESDDKGELKQYKELENL